MAADCNTADCRCAERGATIPFVSGRCRECADVTLPWLEEDAAAANERAHTRQQERDLLGETGPTNTERDLRDAGRKT